MTDGGPSLTLRVFLASPGDVAEERAFVRAHLESALPKHPLLRGRRVVFDVLSWDDPHAPTPMPADQTPQQAVEHFKGRPATCDIVVVIIAGRLGTHLSLDTYRKPDGSAYLSGTEWEYEDAWNATPRPAIRVYRRKDIPPIQRDDPDRRKQHEQWDKVDGFFERFSNQDGSARGGYQEYNGLDDFRTKFTHDLAHIVAQRLGAESATPSPDTTPDTAAIVPPARCFGRDADVAALVTALTAPWPAALLVLGPAGIGKTTLTRRVATDAAVATRFAARRWFVELETANDAATLRIAIVQAIGHNPAATTFAEALAWLAQRPGLLVLDNLETPWEQDQRAVQDSLQVLATMPGLSLLCSLREAAAPPNPRWTRPPTILRPLPEDEARRLFLELAPGIAADDPHLALFLRALGGVPLAVELVALRAAGDGTLRELWAEWGLRGPVLAAHPDLPPDHRLTSLTRSLDLSWHSRRLRDEGRLLFRLLGQLPAGIAEADRTALLGDTAAEAGRQLRAVGLAFGRDNRLDLLPPVRGYARTAHPPEGEAAALWVRHYLALARDMGRLIFGAEGANVLGRLAPEWANIDAALNNVTAQEFTADAAAMLNGVYRLMSATGAGSLAALNACAMTYHTANDARGEAWSRYTLGLVAFDRSEHDAAREAYQQALPLFKEAGEVLGEANCVFSIGVMAERRYEHDTARTALQQAIQLYRQLGDVLGEGNCVCGLADIAMARSDYGVAQEEYQRAQLLYRRAGGLRGEANCIQRLGSIAMHLLQYDAARAAFQEALKLSRQVGDVLGQANCTAMVGRLEQHLGDL
jgi:tetratricopeptide (TPR) repeat protein